MTDQAELTRINDALAAADGDLVTALEARAKAVRQFIELRDSAPDAYLTLTPSVEVIRAALESALTFPKEGLVGVMREALGACDAMIAPVRVAVLAPLGGFGHVAAERYFGSSAEVVAKDSTRSLFDDVDRRRCSFGVVPFETSTDGALAQTLDALMDSEARISGELTILCSYDLVSATGNRRDIERVCATPTAVAACEIGLKRELPGAAVLDVPSGIVAAELAAEDHGTAALIAGWSESNAHGLRLVQGRVEDNAEVEARFVVIGHDDPRRTGNDGTILALGLGDDPGSLYKSLQPFAERGINLTRIESRPAKGTSWRYVFILELDGHVSDRSVMTAVNEVRTGVRHLKILGSYPRPRDA